MPLSSLFQRLLQGLQPKRPAVTDAIALSQSDVEAVRARARRRLVGMLVLVGAGVIGFPWLFETQPRPMSSDIQVVQAPSAETDPALAPLGGSRSSRTAKPILQRVVPEAPAAREESKEIVEAPEPASPAPDRAVKLAPKAASSAPTSRPAPAPTAKPAAKDAKDPKPATEKDAPTKTLAKSDGDRAKALLDDKPVQKPATKPAAATAQASSAKPAAEADKPASGGGARYIVQVGAFSDGPTAHEARMKVERLGIKTYTQAVETSGGKKIRVRVGPFADKAEADKAMATLKKAGLVGALLTL